MSRLRQPVADTSGSSGPPKLEQLVSDISALVTPPTVCVKMYDLVRSDNATARDIGELVALDPNLTGRLLKIVNSAYFGFSSSIDTIDRAVTAIGVRDLYNLVLAITAVRSFSGLRSGLVSMDTFWRHSVMCALLARELAKSFGVANPERFFVTGLLHDIGVLVMYSQLGEHVAAMREALDRGERSLHAAEFERFGYTHACVGAEVLSQWALPASLRSGVRGHHTAPHTQPANLDAALIQLADMLTDQCDGHSLHQEANAHADTHSELLRLLDKDSDTFDAAAIVEKAHSDFGQAMANLMP